MILLKIYNDCSTVRNNRDIEILFNKFHATNEIYRSATPVISAPNSLIINGAIKKSFMPLIC
jgi:hypothetical protein